VGREIDASFLAELPAAADPCGENGEFHSFAYDGPMFCRPVAFSLGEKLLRDNRFYYCDLLPPE
jgi:diphthamide synthase (EF-2-diphthine--ammonia ligase)